MDRYLMVSLALSIVVLALLGACAPASGVSSPTPRVSPTAVHTPTPPATTATPVTETPTATPERTGTPVGTPLPTWTPMASPSPTPDTVAGPQAATALQANARCSDTEPRKGVAELSWTPARDAGDAQRVDVTVQRDGFAAGSYTSSPLLQPQESSLLWEDVQGSAIHFWRVATRHGDAWIASEAGEFVGETCVADFVGSPAY